MKTKNLLIVIPVLLTALIVASSSANAINLIVDGMRLKLDQPPLSKNGMIFVPLRGIFEKLGARVTYEKSTKTIYARRKKTSMQLTLDNPFAKIDGSTTRMLRPAFERNGRAYVPLRFISESLGCRVGWHPPTATVAISSRAGKDPFDGVDFNELERISLEDKKKEAKSGNVRYDPLKYIMNHREAEKKEQEKNRKKGKIEKIKPGIKTTIKPVKPVDPDKPDEDKDKDDDDIEKDDEF